MSYSGHIEEISRLSTSDRLRLWAKFGSMVLEMGPIEDDSAVFGERIINSGFLPIAVDASIETIRENVHAAHSIGRWAQYGFNVFDLSTDLAASLLLTDPAPLEEELRLPFPCFFIRLPPGIVPIFIHGRQEWADGIWCHRFRSNHESFGHGTDFFRWTVERKGLSLWKDRFPTNLEDPVDEFRYNQTWDGDPPYVPEDDITTSKALRIIRNFVGWLDATGGVSAYPKPTPPHIKRKASSSKKQDIANGIWPHVWVFGQNVKLRPELRKMATEFALSQSKDHSSPGWKIRIKHVVRGHFKNQPFGEGRQQRKKVWVEPYWRGPDGAAAWAHLYSAG